MDITPIALTVAEAAHRARIGKSRLFQSIKDGDLPAKKIGRRTVILREDLANWLASLPPANRSSKHLPA
jgi:excisionase family DNA binding protein